jgi:hypothetical protein
MPDGTIDAGFDSGAVKVRTLGLQKDGKVLIGGQFTTVNGLTRSGIARLNADGSVDRQFYPWPDSPEVEFLACLPDGGIVAGSPLVPIMRFNGSPAPRIASLHRLPNGSAGLSVLTHQDKTCVLQASLNLTDWISLATNTAAGCSWLFTDIEAAGLPRRFYRALQLDSN